MDTRAFDDTRPPQTDLLDDCVHCGFCLPTCPTYTLWGEELDSPRGRNGLMREGLRQGSEQSDGVVAQVDRCLGRIACIYASLVGRSFSKLLQVRLSRVSRIV